MSGKPQPSRADRLAAVHAHYGPVEHRSHDVPGYLWSWVETGMGHGLNAAAEVILGVRLQTYRLALCEALEMVGGDGYHFAAGAGKDEPLSSVVAKFRVRVREAGL